MLTSILLFDAAYAAEVSGYLVLTTDYVFRGVTYSDGSAFFAELHGFF